MKKIGNTISFADKANFPKTNVLGGFTLIEMLVVMLIIAILAAILLPTINRAYSRAKISTVQKSLIDFERAVDAYRSEYGRLPMPGGQGGDSAVSTNVLVDIIKALQGDKNIATIPNPKKITFYESDLVSTNYAFKDPWSKWIQVYFDGDYDNEITVSGHTFRRNVVAQSYGPDGKTGGDKSDDDILSVQIED